ncbi:UNVERIFIED_CONTAM: hypothetical protein NCL1_53873 [Trichonephila clavipes]
MSKTFWSFFKAQKMSLKQIPTLKMKYFHRQQNEKFNVYAYFHVIRNEEHHKKSKIHIEECCKKVIPEEDHIEEAKHWQYYCDNPVYIGKILDCLFTEEYLKSLTDEDISALKKFKDCAKGIKEQYCNEA